MRDGAVVARRAHNPKVIGSSPVPATYSKGILILKYLFFLCNLSMYSDYIIGLLSATADIGSPPRRMFPLLIQKVF